MKRLLSRFWGVFVIAFLLCGPVLAGGIISYLIYRYHKKRNTPKEVVQQGDKRGLLLASGLITGEALMGVLVAIPKSLKIPLAVPIPEGIIRF